MSYLKFLQSQLDGIEVGEKRVIDDGNRDRYKFNAAIAAISSRTKWRLRTRKVDDKMYVQRYDSRTKEFKNPSTNSALIAGQLANVAVGQCVMLDTGTMTKGVFHTTLSNVCKQLKWRYKTMDVMDIKHFWRLS